MIDRLVEKAKGIVGGENGYVRLPAKNPNGKACLVDGLLLMTSLNRLAWFRSEEFTLCVCGDYLIVVIRHANINAASRYYGGTIDRYVLTVFKGSEAVMRYADVCDNAAYNTDSLRLPVMDLFDMVTDKKKRKPPTAHVCGSHGFGHNMNDRCPACEER